MNCSIEGPSQRNVKLERDSGLGSAGGPVAYLGSTRKQSSGGELTKLSEISSVMGLFHLKISFELIKPGFVS